MMDTFGDYQLEKGDMVLITADCRQHPCKDAEMVAQYCGLKDIEVFESMTTSPAFGLENGDLIFGYECFWLPLGEANKIRVEKGLPQLKAIESISTTNQKEK